MNLVIVVFLVFLLIFAGIGAWSAVRHRRTTEDYLVAGREVNGWLTALSSMATNNSGYAFIGLVGFAYRFGLHTVWLSVAWILGDLCVWLWVHQRVRQRAGEINATSVPMLLATDRRGRTARGVVMLAGLLTFIFLGVYAAAQLKAGSLALTSLFGWHIHAGAIIGAVIVVIYCFSGGLRASIWTDAAQSVVMIVAMSVLLVVAYIEVDGFTGLLATLESIDPSLAKLFPENLSLGFGLYFLGFVAGGFGAIGAPHILIRSMAVESIEQFRTARKVYLSTFIPFVLASALIGLYSRALMPELASPPEAMAGASAEAINQILVQQAEQSLPLLAIKLLPEILVGMMLAAIFAATMSTADSQILSCSAAVTQDMAPRWNGSYLAAKLATLGVTALALTVAIYAGDGVFALVLVAWSALGASLGPILLLRLANKPIGNRLGIVMMLAGLATVVLWDRSAYASDVFKLLPGLAAPFAIYAIVAVVRRRSDKGDAA